MADEKISAMPNAAALTGAELVPVVQGGNNVKATTQNIANLAPAVPVGANPTATAGPAAVNGSAATFMRSDGAPPVQKGTAAQFGIVEVDGTTITSAAGVISAVQPAGANPTATAGPAAVNGSASTFMRSDGAPAVQKGTAAQFGIVEVDGTTITSAAGVISAVQPAGANPAATAGPAAVNGSAATFMRSDGAPAVQLGSASQKGIVQVDGTTITAAAGVISAVGGGGTITNASTPTSGFAVGDIIVSDTGNVVGKVPDVAVNQILASGGVGTKPAYTATPTITSVTFGSGTALNDYEEGTWTPTDGSGAGLTFTVTRCTYTRIGRLGQIQMTLSYPANASAAQAQIAGVPFTFPANVFAQTMCGTSNGLVNFYSTSSTLIGYTVPAAANLSNAALSSSPVQGQFENPVT